jgi:hypothetical protein
MNNNLERVRKKAVVNQLKIPSLHLSGGTEENTKTLNYGNRSSGRNLNPGPPEYEEGVLANHSTGTFGDDYSPE